jgi:hypothetical protein
VEVVGTVAFGTDGAGTGADGVETVGVGTGVVFTGRVGVGTGRVGVGRVAVVTPGIGTVCPSAWLASRPVPAKTAAASTALIPP